MTERKPDALEVRAREMCVNRGIDPDSRVPKPVTSDEASLDGMWKTWPAWCQYREKAREERNLVARIAASDHAALTVQPAEYQNAPLTIFGEAEDQTVQQMKNCMSYGNVVAGVLCADNHLGYSQPVGGVIAYENQISISGVGYDIACGNKAVRLDVQYKDIKANTAQLLEDIRANISFGVGQINATPVEHPIFDEDDQWQYAGMLDYKKKAQGQLGTVGSGNHYVDLFYDEQGWVWIGIHFGSRGLGHTIATRGVKLAGGKDGIHAVPSLVDVDSEIGRQYLAGMDLAGQYAYAGRNWVVERVRQMIGGSVTAEVHNHHNYAWLEEHNGRKLWVVRKGATPAFPGQFGFVGGSMAENAVIIKGIDSDVAADSLYSTVHGAGRVMGRQQAKRTFRAEQMQEWLRTAGVQLSGGGLDESPMAYKRLGEVLDYHKGAIQIVHNLKPFAVAMAGSSDFDPWKD